MSIPPTSRARTGPPESPERSASVSLSAEQLVAATEWVESGHVRLRRRIVSETRTIEVVVRREELVVDVRDAAFAQVGESYLGTALDGPPVAAPERPGPPLVMVLREEVPEVVLRPQVYQRVSAEVVTVEQMAVWHDRVRHEEVDVGTTLPA